MKCNHKGIGEPGCSICDVDDARVINALRAEVERLTRERDAAREEGKEYAYAVGQIEAIFGKSGAPSVGDVVHAVRELKAAHRNASEEADEMWKQVEHLKTQLLLLKGIGKHADAQANDIDALRDLLVVAERDRDEWKARAENWEAQAKGIANFRADLGGFAPPETVRLAVKAVVHSQERLAILSDSEARGCMLLNTEALAALRKVGG